MSREKYVKDDKQVKDKFLGHRYGPMKYQVIDAGQGYIRSRTYITVINISQGHIRSRIYVKYISLSNSFNYNESSKKICLTVIYILALPIQGFQSELFPSVVKKPHL